MRRTPLVLAGTVVGLAGVLGFHTSPAKISIGIVGNTAGATTPGSTTTAPTTTSSPPPTTTTANAASNNAPTTTVRRTTTTVAHPTTTTTVATTATRSAVGPLVNYYFGELSVKVTATGKKITAVTISSLNDGGNYRSQSIDQASIPMLEQEVMTAQSANIQGISGASYTSAGFAQSLQGALKSLGI